MIDNISNKGTTFGLVNVNANTLQHVKYKNIWSAGIKF